MVSRSRRRKSKETRKYREKRYEKHRRHNMLYAEPGVHDFVIVLDHLKPAFNIGKIYRSAEAFGAKAVHLVGIQYFDTKAAKGSFKWVPTLFHENFESCYATLAMEEYELNLLEPGAEDSLHTIGLAQKSAFIIGHEEFGVSFDRTLYEKIRSVKIEQLGRVDSLNVSIAASIAMYEYCRQHGAGPPPGL